MQRNKHPYQVHKQTSGRSWDTFIVVRNPGGRRVSVNPHITRESAQASADDLNIGALVKPYADDPRPYEERYVEATATYREEGGR